MLNLLTNVYTQVAPSQLITKSGEMISIAREVYRLSRTEDPNETPEAPSRIQFYENCYMTAVKNVTKNDEKAMNDRWDVRIVSSGAQKANDISQKCQSVTQSIQKKAESLNERVRWSGRALNRQLKRRASSCAKLPKKVYRRFQSQTKRAVKAYKFSKKLVKKSIEKTRKTTARLRLKMHKKVDSLVVAPVKKLSQTCSDQLKPYYESTRNRICTVAWHSKQTACDMKDLVLETAADFSEPLRARTMDVVMPKISEKVDALKRRYSMKKKVMGRKMEHVGEILAKNKMSMMRMVVFSWELCKDAFGENSELVQHMFACNKEYVGRYLGDIDLEVFYGKNKSMSLREMVVSCGQRILSVFAPKSEPEKSRDLGESDISCENELEFSGKSNKAEDHEFEAQSENEERLRDPSELETKEDEAEKRQQDPLDNEDLD